MPSNDVQTRFGTLDEVVERQGPKGPYCTFTIQCKGFQQIGAAFGAKLTQDLQALRGGKVRVRGVFDERTLADGRTVQSFKAIWAGRDTTRVA